MEDGEAPVPVVLDCVVGAAGQELRDLRPAVAQAFVRVDKHGVLLCTPRFFHHNRVQLKQNVTQIWLRMGAQGRPT